MFHKLMKEIVPLGFIIVGILAMLKGDGEVWAICTAAGWYFHLKNMKENEHVSATKSIQ